MAARGTPKKQLFMNNVITFSHPILDLLYVN